MLAGEMSLWALGRVGLSPVAMLDAASRVRGDKDVRCLARGIPYGETVSYGAIARAIGRPGASRAVGAANGANPLPIVVPCHRVIGSTGKLTGFGGGLDLKAALLALERGRAGAGGQGVLELHHTG